MKILTEKLTVNSEGNCDIVNITNEVQGFVNKHKLSEGNATVFVVGSTASISTVEYEPGLKKDIPQILDKLVPPKQKYHHHDTWGDYNGHAHVRSTNTRMFTDNTFCKRGASARHMAADCTA